MTDQTPQFTESEIQKMLAAGLIDKVRAAELRKNPAPSKTTTENVTATDGGIGVGRDVGRDVITGEGNTVTTIINNFADASQLEIDEKQLRKQIADYLRWVVDHHRTIELRGIKRKGEQVVQLDLEMVYVPLATDVARGGVAAVGGLGGGSHRLRQPQTGGTLAASQPRTRFDGKLVSQDPNDEPASMLLARIRAERGQAKPQKKRWSKK